MFVRVSIPAVIAVPPSPYSDLGTKVEMDESGPVFEFYTDNSGLYREFHHFAQLFVEDLEQRNKSVPSAFNDALIRWLELGSRKALLTPEQQLGLLGEVLVLAELVSRRGQPAVLAWTGRNEEIPDRHDFRFDSIDMEVKSTRSSRREHIVHGLRQLTPSLHHHLYLLSLRFEPAGISEGTSLPDGIATLRKLLTDPSARDLFDKQLEVARYSDDHAANYSDKMKLADNPMLIRVDERCPRLTDELVYQGLGASLASRVKKVSYQIDLEGLGVAQGTEPFTKVLGAFTLA
jgi:hypothetical protein